MRSTKWLIAGALISAALVGAGTLIVRLGPSGVYLGAGIVIAAGVSFIIFGTSALIYGFRLASANPPRFEKKGTASNLRLALSLALTFLLCNALLFFLIRPPSIAAFIAVNIIVPFAWLFARYFSFRVVERSGK